MRAILHFSRINSEKSPPLPDSGLLGDQAVCFFGVLGFTSAASAMSSHRCTFPRDSDSSKASGKIIEVCTAVSLFGGWCRGIWMTLGIENLAALRCARSYWEFY